MPLPTIRKKNKKCRLVVGRASRVFFWVLGLLDASEHFFEHKEVAQLSEAVLEITAVQGGGVPC